MICFIAKEQPKSYNSLAGNRKTRYYSRIQDAFVNYYPHNNPITSELYGVVYYFFKDDVGLDVDNISKPIWDALKSHVYDDDKQIKIRIAGV